MPDRENVINGLREMSCRATWKDIDRIRDKFQPIINDALAMLKEQEAVSVDVCGQMFTVKYGHCPKCNEGLNSEVYPHWCGFCGQAVKWND